MDDDEDVRLQREFMQQRVAPSTRVRREGAVTAPAAVEQDGHSAVVTSVKEEGSLMGDCPPPSAKPNAAEGFPGVTHRRVAQSKFAQRRQRQQQQQPPQDEPAPRASLPDRGTASVGAVDWDAEWEKIRRENSKLMASMSEEDILREQRELLAMLPKETVTLFREGKHALQTSPTSASDESVVQEPPPLSQSPLPPQDVRPVLKNDQLGPVTELLLPPIEHDKLAWTDPESVQKPRDKSVDLMRSLRVQAIRFGLEGEILAAGIEEKIDTYAAALHHHGEDPDKPGYTLDELLTLTQSQNDAQNALALTIVARLLERVAAKKDGRFLEQLYPEAGTLSMTVGEGILWELLAVNWPVSLRIGLSKRATTVRNAAMLALHSFCFACTHPVFDQERTRNQQLFQHTGLYTIPSAPLFEDDGSEEMGRMDGLRVLVEQLDLLSFIAAHLSGLSTELLECIACLCGHSIQIARAVGSVSGLLEEIVRQHIVNTTPATSVALRVLRLLVATDRYFGITLEQTGAATQVLRFLVVTRSTLSASIFLEATLLLKSFLFYGLQVGPFVDMLPSLIPMMENAQETSDAVLSMAESALVWVSHSDPGMFQQLLALLRASLPMSVTFLHFLASVLSISPQSSQNKSIIQDLIKPRITTLTAGPSFVYPLLRALSVEPALMFSILPSSFWKHDVRSQFSPPQAWCDTTNRFKTQRRIALLEKERQGILTARQFCLACARVYSTASAAGDSPFSPSQMAALFGVAVDLVGCLALAGLDEWLCRELITDFILEPNVLCVVVDYMSPPSSSEAAAESRHQVGLLCQTLFKGVCQAFFPAAEDDWITRSRMVSCEFYLAPDKSVASTFVGRDVMCASTFIGADWIWSMFRHQDVAVVRAALQLSFVSDVSGSARSFSEAPAHVKFLRLVPLLKGSSIGDTSVESTAFALFKRWEPKLNLQALTESSDPSVNVFQAATDLMELVTSLQSPLLYAFVFFFMRADLPHDFRVLAWSSLAGSWRLLALEESKINFEHHLRPFETDKKVLSLMEDSLRSGALTERTNQVVYWIAIHHLAARLCDSQQTQWNRDQLRARLGPYVVAKIDWYLLHYLSSEASLPFPPPMQ